MSANFVAGLALRVVSATRRHSPKAAKTYTQRNPTKNKAVSTVVSLCSCASTNNSSTTKYNNAAAPKASTAASTASGAPAKRNNAINAPTKVKSESAKVTNAALTGAMNRPGVSGGFLRR
ncbi:hypothetical protein RSal33209_1770 [Renibacterium salmoninarum ATCC 33209]|uniref:Uncharacterized protein n=1 Tax=Renibacterium salmoninarum (strain ATCC 33209 / DSM 20767 / JCM 11484 / NBRC 15589 / NCIMB 2235) TaxID=288705 RepID=A9WMX4_RENSM|nr:hypothetical protein RSal33209_1770 [Renibacterium salmoninarum ATCC 33209]